MTNHYHPHPRSFVSTNTYPVPDHLFLPPHVRLTDRETEVVKLLLRGYPDRLIAGTIAISVASVKDTLSALYLAYGVRGRVELAIKALGCPVRPTDKAQSVSVPSSVVYNRRLTGAQPR